jgi:NTP pyrophosphatase (non-canonical NTP hydrolase)
MNEIYQKLIDKFGVEHQELILIEEMSELTKAIIKKRRGLEQNIAEELADVQIMLDQLKIIYPQWKSWEQIKINHIEQNIL